MKTYIPLEGSKQGNYLKIEVRYDMGGYNYLTSQKKERGYYVSVTPVHRDDKFERMTAFSGLYSLIEPTKRYNAKRFEAIVKTYLNPDNETTKGLIYAITSRG